MSHVFSYRSDRGERRGLLVKRGRRLLTIIMVSYPVRVETVPITEERYMRTMDYSVEKTLRLLREMVRLRHGKLADAPKNLKQALRLASSNANKEAS